MRARVPDHVAGGQISTGVIVVTGATEYILDFVRNLPRPNMIVARVVLPHGVMPQFIEALTTNISLYRQRFGDLTPQLTTPSPTQTLSDQQNSAKTAQTNPKANNPWSEPLNVLPGMEFGGSGTETTGDGQPGDAGKENNASANPDGSSGGNNPESGTPPAVEGQLPSSGAPGFNPPPVTRHPSPQEVYDELKLKDELLSGTYANAVMIGHGPHEFSFDFITNFYPQSAVSCRVFMAAGHVGRLLDSLKASWDQLRPRLGGGPT